MKTGSWFFVCFFSTAGVSHPLEIVGVPLLVVSLRSQNRGASFGYEKKQKKRKQISSNTQCPLRPNRSGDGRDPVLLNRLTTRCSLIAGEDSTTTTTTRETHRVPKSTSLTPPCVVNRMLLPLTSRWMVLLTCRCWRPCGEGEGRGGGERERLTVFSDKHLLSF